MSPNDEMSSFSILYRKKDLWKIKMNKTIVIIGGGIAGTSCAEHILQCQKYHNISTNVLIITPKDVIKTAITKKEISKTLTEIEVNEKKIAKYEEKETNVSVQVGTVVNINPEGISLLYGFRTVP